MESKSRRHVVQIGKIDGNNTKLQASPKTRRRTNDVRDIDGAAVKVKGVAPAGFELPQKKAVLNKNASDIFHQKSELKENKNDPYEDSK